MKLRSYRKKQGISLNQMRDDLVSMYGSAPAYSTLWAIDAGTQEPKLELAAMILEWSKDEITIWDLVTDHKYTSVSGAIYEVVEQKKVKEIFDGAIEGTSKQFEDLLKMFDE